MPGDSLFRDRPVERPSLEQRAPIVRLARAGTVEIVKTKSDAFANPLLDEQLALRRVSEVYIAGLDAGFCVNKTIRGALNRGYKVKAIRDAIATRHSKPVEEHIADYEAAGAVAMSLESAKGELSRATAHETSTAERRPDSGGN